MANSRELPEAATVFVVDPDPSTGTIVRELLDGTCLRCEVFRSGRDFLAAYRMQRHGCLVLEQRIPDMSGLQIQHRLAAAGMHIPLIFVMNSPELSTAVELMRGGAVHVLEKPLRSIDLLTTIQEAIEVDQNRGDAKDHQSRIKRLTEALTQKERHVLELVAQGKSAKQIATEVQRSVRAVELRRRSLMRKLRVRSSLELMRFSVIAQHEFGGTQRAISAAISGER